MLIQLWSKMYTQNMYAMAVLCFQLFLQLLFFCDRVIGAHHSLSQNMCYGFIMGLLKMWSNLQGQKYTYSNATIGLHVPRPFSPQWGASGKTLVETLINPFLQHCPHAIQSQIVVEMIGNSRLPWHTYSLQVYVHVDHTCLHHWHIADKKGQVLYICMLWS